MGKAPRGRGVSYERYVMMTLRTMYEAGIVHFTVGDVCSWSGAEGRSSIKDILEKLVTRGWLSVVPVELNSSSRARTYTMQNAVWFGGKADVS